MDDKELDKMAKDIEPAAEPVEAEAPDGFVEDRETYVKPDGETTASPKRSKNVIKEDSGKGKWVLRGLATILILGLGGATAWAYTDAQSVRNKLQSVKIGLDAARSDAANLRAEVAAAKAEIAKVEKNQTADATEAETDETLVINEAAAVAEARGFGTSSKITVLKIGNKYAKVSVSGGQTPYELLLKKAATKKHWVSLWIGPDAKEVPAEVVDDFEIPAEFTQ